MFCFLQAAQIEAEKQRQREWEKRKKEELLNHKNMEQDIVNNLKSRVQKLEEELLKVVSEMKLIISVTLAGISFVIVQYVVIVVVVICVVFPYHP